MGEAKGTLLIQKQVHTRRGCIEMALFTSRVSSRRADKNQGCNNISQTLFKKFFKLLCLLSRPSLRAQRAREILKSIGTYIPP